MAPAPLGRLIARAYLEAMDALDPASEYIGRATMDILERELARPEWRRLEQPLPPPQAAETTEIAVPLAQIRVAGRGGAAARELGASARGTHGPGR